MPSNTSFPLEIQELRRPNVIHVLNVKWSNTIKDIKGKLSKITKYPSSRMRLLRSSSSLVLDDSQTLGAIGIDQAGHVLVVSFEFGANPQYVVEVVPGAKLDSECKEMICQVRQGMNTSHIPAKTDLLDCTGGVYFMKSTQGNLSAVFKPMDEEQGMPNNPKGHAGLGREGLRPFLKPGEGCLHERAAYLLDYDHFCQVPPTVIAHVEHPAFNYTSKLVGDLGMFPKRGSLQRYVRASDTFEDISPSLIGTLELQKIALLDIRLLNCDRNASNILAIRKLLPHTFNNGVRARRGSRSGSELSWSDVLDDDEVDAYDFLEEEEARSGKSAGDDCYELIPIDHGYCFPARLLIEDFDWAWFHCQQISRPVDPAIKAYLESFDLEELLQQMSEEVVLSDDSLFLIRVVHHLLLNGIKRGLTLRDIAGMIARTEDGKPSSLEKIINSAEENALRALEISRPSFRNKSKAILHSRSPVTVIQRSPVRESIHSSSNTKDRLAYLCSENIELLSKQIEGARASTETVNEDDDYFVNDLTATEESSRRPLRAGPGDALTYMRSLDASVSSTASSSSSSSFTSSSFSSNVSSSYRFGNWISSPLPSVAECVRDVASVETSSSSSDPDPSPRTSTQLDPLTLEAVSSQPLEDKPTLPSSHRRRPRSDTTTSEDEMGGYDSPSSDYDAPPMTRVSSFAALHSPPLYDMEMRSGRQLNLLKREKGRGALKRSTEFLARRLNFAKEAVDKLLKAK